MAIVTHPTFDIEDLKSRIYIVRGKQVMLDRDLAELYGVETRRLNEAVKRNIERFPEDFMFRINEVEWKALSTQIVIPINNIRSQFATASKSDDSNLMSQFATSSWGGVRKMPNVFTELGVAMLSSVLRSETAIQVNINIMRAFVAIRHAVASMQDKDLRMEQLSHRVDQMDASITEILHEQGDMRREQEEANAEMALQIEALNDALDQLRDAPAPKRNKIGFKTDNKE
jgi:hypothetical protein